MSEEQADTTWFHGLDEELQSDERLSEIKDKGVDHLAKQYVESQKHISGTVKLLGEDATDEERVEYHNKIRPEVYEDYVGGIEIRESEHTNPEFFESMNKKAHELGLTQTQTRELANYQTELVEAQVGEVRAEEDRIRDESEAELKKEWGAALEKNLSIVNRTVKHFGGEDVLKTIKESPTLGNNVGMIKMLYEVGKKLQEDKVIVDGDYSKGGKESAKEKLEVIMNDKSDPYWATDNSDVHLARVKEVQQLYELAHN